MPCNDCGHLLCVDNERSSLICPRCEGIRVEGNGVIQAKTNWLLEDYLTDENILHLVENYSKTDLILASLTRLNQISNVFINQNGMPVSDFGYLAYIIRAIYEKDNFGTERLEFPLGPGNEIEILKDAYTMILSAYRDANEQFCVCIRNDDFDGEWSNFVSDYTLRQSEYGLCFERCVESILCGDPEHYEDYSYVADVLREVDKTDVNNVDTIWEFGDAWYQFIIQLRLMASADKMVGDIYGTRLPSNITIFDIEAFIDALDDQFTQLEHDYMREEGDVAILDRSQVDQCGERIFGETWKQVQNQIIVNEDNLDAHPFLFELETIERQRISKNRYRKVPTQKVFYPRFFAKILKFQIFPLLKNGDEPSGHDILTRISGDRGKVYERNIYEYLTERGIECYHSAKLTNQDSHEIDILCVLNDSIVFIEIKYLLPPIHINSQAGIQVLDQKFNLKIFNETSDESDRDPEGIPFPDIVQEWTQLEPGDRFHSQVDRGSSGRAYHVVKDEWCDLEVKQYVVSNVVPSYIMKNGVRFLTDLEFYELIEHDDESVLYELS